MNTSQMDFAMVLQGNQMNTHDKIELPPLPEPGEAMSKWAYDEQDMQAYALSATEADRKTTEKQLAAYSRLVNSLESRLTDLQAKHDELKKSTNPDLLASERAANAILTEELEADRQRRGEPNYFTYVINGHHRGISETEPPDDSYDEGTLQRLFATPQPAEPSRGEPVAWVSEQTILEQTVEGRPRRVWWECNEGVGFPIYRDAQPAEPVRMCDCERSHNGMGMAGRKCDCQTEPVSPTALAKEQLGLPPVPHRLNLGDGLTVMGSAEAIEKVKQLAEPVKVVLNPVTLVTSKYGRKSKVIYSIRAEYGTFQEAEAVYRFAKGL